MGACCGRTAEPSPRKKPRRAALAAGADSAAGQSPAACLATSLNPLDQTEPQQQQEQQAPQGPTAIPMRIATAIAAAAYCDPKRAQSSSMMSGEAACVSVSQPLASTGLQVDQPHCGGPPSCAISGCGQCIKFL